MKNLQRLLFAAAFISVMPSTVVLCSEESTKTAEMGLLTNISYFGGGLLLGTSTIAPALNKWRKGLINNWDKEVVIKQLTNKIKGNNALRVASCLAIAAPIIIPDVVDRIIPAAVDKFNATVDKFNAINQQNKENDKDDKSTV